MCGVSGIICIKTRIIWADYIKGLLILLVILGHTIQVCFSNNFESVHIWNLNYSFHMPAFMAVSGWLSFKGINDILSVDFNLYRYLSACKRRSLQLLVPYNMDYFGIPSQR